MKLTSFAAAAVLAALLASPAAAAVVVNPSFETGDTAGWTSAGAGAIDVLAATDDAIGPAFGGRRYDPTDGGFFAQLTAGPDDQYTTLSQSFTLAGASVVGLDAAFLAFDDPAFDDDAYVRIFDASHNFVLFQFDIVAAGGNQASTGWTHVSQLLAGGTYTIEAGVRNVGDDLTAFEPGFDSKLLVDNVSISAAPVPEPASWALLIAGFAGVGGLLRRRRASVALSA
jgi:opacity protein-like surface antigen